MLLPCFRSEFTKEIRAPIPLETRREQAIEHALNGWVGHGSHVFEDWFFGFNGFEDLFGLQQIAGIAPDDAAKMFMMKTLRKRRSGDRENRNEAVEIVGRLVDEIVVPLHYFLRLFNRPECYAAKDLANGMRLEKKGGNDPKIAAAAANSPEKIRIAAGIGDGNRPVSQDHLHLQQIIDGQPIFPREIADPTAER